MRKLHGARCVNRTRSVLMTSPEEDVWPPWRDHAEAGRSRSEYSNSYHDMALLCRRGY
jgi:hypothetical protein